MRKNDKETRILLSFLHQIRKHLSQNLPHTYETITPHLLEITEILPIFCPNFSQSEKFLPFLLKILPHTKILLP